MHLRLAAPAAVAAAVLLSACGATGEGPSPPGGATNGSAGQREASGPGITVRLFRFQPATATVAAGTTVVWTNEDDILHTVTSGEPAQAGVPGVSEGKPAKPDGTFDAQLDGRGSTYRFTFDESGTFRYYCAVHPGMEGRVVVR